MAPFSLLSGREISTSHINYNHLYYFWHACREGSAVGAAEALCLISQTTTEQIRALEECPQGKLFKRKGHGLEPSELGELVYHYTDKIFTLNQEVLNIVNYRRGSSLLFGVGVTDTLPERLVSNVLDVTVVEDEQIHLRCFESTHGMLLEQLSQHKLDMIISDCPIDSTQQEGLFSMKIGECGVGFWCTDPLPEEPLPTCLEERRLLIPGRHSMLGRKLLNWFNSQGLSVKILGEFNDAALMKAFGATYNAIFVAPSPYANDFYNDDSVVEIGRVESVVEEYHAIFTKRMIQHPAIQHIYDIGYSVLFIPTSK